MSAYRYRGAQVIAGTLADTKNQGTLRNPLIASWKFAAYAGSGYRSICASWSALDRIMLT